MEDGEEDRGEREDGDEEGRGIFGIASLIRLCRRSEVGGTALLQIITGVKNLKRAPREKEHSKSVQNTGQCGKRRE